MADLIVERRDGVVRATLNRPEKKNAISYALFDELGELFREIDVRTEDRALILSGSGGDFSTGLDLSDPARLTSGDGKMRERIDQINNTALALHLLSKPTVAVVDGLAAGAGMSLALNCDFVVASTRARFCTVFSRRGLSIDFGMSWVLPRLVGRAQARELAVLAEFVDANEALSLGLVCRVVEVEQLEMEVDRLATHLATGPTIAYSNTLDLLDRAETSTFSESLNGEAEVQMRNLATEDVAEALDAFIGKRKAEFRGR